MKKIATGLLLMMCKRDIDYLNNNLTSVSKDKSVNVDYEFKLRQVLKSAIEDGVTPDWTTFKKYEDDIKERDYDGVEPKCKSGGVYTYTELIHYCYFDKKDTELESRMKASLTKGKTPIPNKSITIVKKKAATIEIDGSKLLEENPVNLTKLTFKQRNPKMKIIEGTLEIPNDYKQANERVNTSLNHILSPERFQTKQWKDLIPGLREYEIDDLDIDSIKILAYGLSYLEAIWTNKLSIYNRVKESDTAKGIDVFQNKAITTLFKNEFYNEGTCEYIDKYNGSTVTVIIEEFLELCAIQNEKLVTLLEKEMLKKLKVK